MQPDQPLRPLVLEEAEPGSLTTHRPGHGHQVLSGFVRSIEGDIPPGTPHSIVCPPEGVDAPMRICMVLYDAGCAPDAEGRA